MLRLWGRANSSNVMKVVWLLEELKLPYERIDVGGPFGKTDTPEYRTMNPTGLVPTLDDNGFALFESNAIMRYVAGALVGETPLWPRDAKRRATVDQWLDLQQTAMNRPQGIVFISLVRTPPEKRDMAAIAQATEEAGKAWAFAESALARHPYLCGDSLTLADIAWGVHAHRWITLDITGRPDCPAVRAWYARLLERPAYKEHCARPIT